MIPGTYGGAAVSGGATPIEAAYQAGAHNGVNAATYTFSSVSLGAAFEGRRIIVGVHTSQNTGTTLAYSGATLAGASMAAIGSHRWGSGWQGLLGLFLIEDATNTSADIVVTVNATTRKMGLAVWSVSGLTSALETPMDSAAANATSSPISSTLDIAAGGAVVAVAGAITGGREIQSWTGLAERYETSGTNTPFAAASDDFSVGETGRSIIISHNDATYGGGLLAVSLGE